MPGLYETQRNKSLEEGETFVGLYDPTKDIGQEPSNFGTRYTFILLDSKSGKFVPIRGGGRLFDRILSAMNGSKDAKWLSITAKGKTATFDRDYDVKEVPAPSR
jgi:hypothetical protein